LYVKNFFNIQLHTTTHTMESWYPDFDFSMDTPIGRFKNFGTAKYPIVITLGSLFHPVKPYIFVCQVKIEKEGVIVYPEDYKCLGMQPNGRVYIPKEQAHKILGEWWLSTIWPSVKEIPGITKRKAFYRFNCVEMNKYVPAWSNNWQYYSNDVCEVMNFD